MPLKRTSILIETEVVNFSGKTTIQVDIVSNGIVMRIFSF